jgi:geranylgeranyl transferase type-2 subunit alpha
MHGRLKVRSTAEQEEAKRQEREKKLKFYKKITTACLKKIEENDFEENGLKLTEDILFANPDVITLWNLRRKILLNLETFKTLDELDTVYKSELDTTEIALRQNPKSYGSWSHRQWCFLHSTHLNVKSAATNWQNELQLCNKYLDLDERNFHCWAHRQFIVNQAKISKFDELQYTYDKISANFSNYSSWHYRSKLIKDLYLSTEENTKLKITENFFQTEITLIENAVFTDPNDQSAWIYHRWLFNEYLHNNTLRSIKYANSIIELKFMKNFNLLDRLISINLNNLNISDKIQWSSSTDALVWNGKIDMEGQSSEIKAELCFKGIGDLHYLLQKNGNSDHEYESIFVLNADEALLEAHLINMLELTSLELNKNKWCLVTLVYLMSFIDYAKYKENIENYLSLLINQIDCNRRQYYIDWKEKILAQNV